MSNKVIINASKNGPYVLTNLKHIQESVGIEAEIDSPAVALCRCGESSTKPYCDGTHGRIEFKDHKEEGHLPRLSEAYIGKEITIHDDRGICSHAGFCTDGLPKVFRMRSTPWIDPDAETVDKIIKTIRKCPSGALSYSIDGVKYDSFSDKPTVTISEDGPYFVKGGISLEVEDQPESKEHYALCRCGHSKNKPYCNGQHWYLKFKDDGLVKNPKSKLNVEGFDSKFDSINRLATTGKSENSAMRTLESFPDFKTILFKGSQLDPMPLNGDIPVKLQTIIGKNARKPLVLALPFYVSHMSFGALSREAKIAMAKGSAIVGTAMCSGEGGMLQASRDAADIYIYEQGTAMFSYDEEVMKKADAVELKIGQGVKPGLGGHLPASKITPEIAKIRGLKEGEDSVSPGRLAGVDSLDDLIKRVDRIRLVTEGVPIGIKIATGRLEEDLAFALKANPDFITIDCRGGATGSSPKFLKDNVGIPAIYAIYRARKYLDSVGSDVTLCATGGFRDSSDIAKGLALGADAIALATASLIAIGCIQSKVCHTGTCPVGIATQDEDLRKLFNMDKAIDRFTNFYNGTAEELKVYARSNGHDDVHKLNVEDLMTTDSNVSAYTNIRHC